MAALPKWLSPPSWSPPQPGLISHFAILWWFPSFHVLYMPWVKMASFSPSVWAATVSPVLLLSSPTSDTLVPTLVPWWLLSLYLSVPWMPLISFFFTAFNWCFLFLLFTHLLLTYQMHLWKTLCVPLLESLAEFFSPRFHIPSKSIKWWSWQCSSHGVVRGIKCAGPCWVLRIAPAVTSTDDRYPLAAFPASLLPLSIAHLSSDILNLPSAKL